MKILVQVDSTSKDEKYSGQYVQEGLNLLQSPYQVYGVDNSSQDNENSNS